MSREYVLMVLVCALASTVGGDYAPPKPSYIIQPAGPSKQHAWVGYGYSDYLPLSIPKPYFIPKWIPHMDPTYTAFWVPETPAPVGRHKGAAAAPAGPPIAGFGPPKGNSVVGAPVHSPPARDVIPQTAIRSPLPPQPQPPLFNSPIPQAPLPIATLPLAPTIQDPLSTFAPAPLGETSALKAFPPAPETIKPPAPAAVNPPAPAFDSSFVPPKGEDLISNSVVQDSGVGGSSYTDV